MSRIFAQRRTSRHIFSTVVLLIVFVIVVFPFLWMVISSFKAEKDIITYPPRIFAASYTLEQYQKVFSAIPLLMYIRNTVIFAFGTTIFSIMLDSMAGYASSIAVVLFVIIMTLSLTLNTWFLKREEGIYQ